MMNRKNGKLTEVHIKIIEEMLDRRGGARIQELAAKVSMSEWWTAPKYLEFEKLKAEEYKHESFDPSNVFVELDKNALSEKGIVKMGNLSRQAHDEALLKYRREVVRLKEESAEERQRIIASYAEPVKEYILEHYGKPIRDAENRLIGFGKKPGTETDAFEEKIGLYYEQSHFRRQPIR